jgi:RNA polymerase-interacting CarD/CdnL/TRCF family regulator|tara:strand:- start:4495 stop:4710 length:216 start_codon:yes stop_codon:yes gene_type:complete
MKSGKIIQIADLINDKLRKEQELEFYEQELQKLLLRMSFVRREINLTNVIIDMIEKEEIPNILKNISKYEV